MSEIKKTSLYGAAAVVLALLAFITAPKRVTPDAFVDQGEEFFPEFKDPNAATSLEVIEFNEETGETVPFKVVFENGKWSIPSHHNYPADGKERLAKTATGLIGIKKDDFRSDNISDHAACGVIDPLDETNTSLKGRGKRVTLRGESGNVLADLIIGKKVEGREGFRFVRLPGQKRVYVSKIDLEVSTKFSDWIDSDLLRVESSNIKEIVINDYSVDERTGRINQRDVVKLYKDGNKWSANKLRSDQEVNSSKANSLLAAIDQLKIVGVRPKPKGILATLKKAEGQKGFEISRSDYLSLRSKGFYFAQDGSLVSNEGELQVKTKDGVIYTLRFGEVAYGSGFELSAGSDSTAASGPAENRYLFITTRFDPSEFKEPKKPRNTDFLNKPDSTWSAADKANKELYDAHEEWKKKIEDGQKISDDLNARFADWYYVISQDSYDKIHLTRKDVIKKKSS